MQEDPNEAANERGKAALLRVGWLVTGSGVLIAMVAAITGAVNQDAPVLPIRNVAAVIMLIGLVLVLAAGRIAQLRAFWFRFAPKKGRSGRTWGCLLLVGFPLFLLIAWLRLCWLVFHL
jgi:hypothetical protein